MQDFFLTDIGATLRIGLAKMSVFKLDCLIANVARLQSNTSARPTESLINANIDLS